MEPPDAGGIAPPRTSSERSHNGSLIGLDLAEAYSPPIGKRSPAFGSPRLVRAFAWAMKLHAHQRRKGSRIPYLAHPLGVASIVLELGGGEDEAIAALLHDTIEDCGVTRAEIARRFGPRVAALVAGASDAGAGEDRGPATSVARKERTVERLRKKAGAARRLALSDKLHNARALGTDHARVGDDLWERFNVGRTEQLRYYRGLVEAFALGGAEPQVAELGRIVRALAGPST